MAVHLYHCCNFDWVQLLSQVCFFSLFTVSQILYALISYSRIFGIILVFLVMAAACYNGASFYIDVFSQRYYFEKVLKGRTKSES
jgi:general stress protein CsbA